MAVFNCQEHSGFDKAKVREIIEDIFFHYQKNAAIQRHKDLGLGTDDDAVKDSIRRSIIRAFANVGESFDNPTVDAVKKVADFINENARNIEGMDPEMGSELANLADCL